MTMLTVDGDTLLTTPPLTDDELGLATRNHGMLLEALRYPVTPVGLHYLLTHYDVPGVDAGRWSLEVGGRVARPLRLDLPTLLSRRSMAQSVTMECAGNGRLGLSPRAISQPWGVEAVGTARWTGTPLRGVLEDAGVLDDACEVLFTGLDTGVEDNVKQTYERSLTITEAMREDVLLAHTINDQPLPPQHGFPLRLIVPGWYGMANVKWLSRITVLNRPFEGYQQVQAYRVRLGPDDPGEPLSRMRPRALLLPPGIPDFMTRERHQEPGAVTLSGRAWSGGAPIIRVDVSSDGGRSWAQADLEKPGDRYAWRGFRAEWNATTGRHLLCVRATDADGATQPLDGEWNVGGYACNAVQVVPITVADKV